MISKNFAINEFRVSSQFPGLARQIDFSPVEAERIRFACHAILEPLRAHFGRPVIITSGKRSPELNRAVGGHPRSHHLFQGDQGAADVVIEGVEPAEMARWLVENTTTDYVIAYTNRGFCHISFPSGSPTKNQLYFK